MRLLAPSSFEEYNDRGFMRTTGQILLTVCLSVCLYGMSRPSYVEMTSEPNAMF